MTRYLIYTDGGTNYRGHIEAASHKKAAKKLSKDNPDDLELQSDIKLKHAEVSIIPASAVQPYRWR